MEIYFLFGNLFIVFFVGAVSCLMYYFCLYQYSHKIQDRGAWEGFTLCP